MDTREFIPRKNTSGRFVLGTSDRILPLPNFIEAQHRSFDWFKSEGVRALFNEINPVKDTLGKMWTLEFGDFEFGKPNRTVRESIDKNLSYDAPLHITVRLKSERTGEIKEQSIFVADVPIMTKNGYFVINGVTKVTVHQIVRAEGVLFEESKTSTVTNKLYSARLMPMNGPWFVFEVNKHLVMTLRLVNKRPKILLTSLLRALGYSSDDEIRELFKDVIGLDRDLIEATLERDSTHNKEQAVIDIYNKIRPDESVSIESAEKYIKGFFFNKRRFDLGRVGRYQLNKKLGLDFEMKPEHYRLYNEDLVQIIRNIILLHNRKRSPDDLDHLANRRIRSVGELLVDEVRSGVLRMEKNIRDRMSMHGEDTNVTPSMLISTKPIAAAVNSFFGTGQLCRFMDQDNIMAELSQKREVTAVGPGGLTKERATFSVRDVHHSHYSRFCPVMTPEGQPIGVVINLALYARINEYGFIEAPYIKVLNKVKNNKKSLLNRIPLEDIKDPKSKKVVVKAFEKITEATAEKVSRITDIKEINVVSFRSEEIIYVAPSEDDAFVITMSTINLDENGNILDKLVSVRSEGHFFLRPAQDVQLMDVTPSQICSVSLAAIACGHNDDPARGLMGSNMQKQAVPLLKTQASIVGTGYEDEIAKQTGWSIYAEEDGEITYVDAEKVVVRYKGQKTDKSYELTTFMGTNHETCFSQKPVVNSGQKLKKGDLIVDGPGIQNGELALGTNLTCAYMILDGYVYEDGFLISERVVKDDMLTSIHIKKYDHEIQETELGPEVLTNDIPNASERALKNLDEKGIVREGSRVRSQDILVGVIAPKGEQELTSEERLLRAIFGEQAHDVRDNSLKVPHGQHGVVIKTQVLDVENGDKLPSGVLKRVSVWVADTKKISFGDKLAGRHGDKGTISGILPVEDMPFMEDGTPVDIIINPIMIKRMNVGQLLEVRLAKIAKDLGIRIGLPNFENLRIDWLYDEAKSKGVNTDERVKLFDGRTGNPFKKKIKVGPKYIQKLKHIADTKIHARSTGPYTLVTQQPLGGKAQMGGQRFGEMEVWALEAHGVPTVLQEMLTIKSDDVKGRADAYKAIIHGEKIETISTPESFKVLIRELNALSLDIDLIYNKADNTDGAEQQPEEKEE
ncbi:DNA-directed RNA polymerase subunit beta [Candidatus Dojkabacteria bacterium]|nr:DNA-directed RNA polymerase subunit beta [Candidatus Dojkabacteria bacterium]